jgi:hypothetical protein
MEPWQSPGEEGPGSMGKGGRVEYRRADREGVSFRMSQLYVNSVHGVARHSTVTISV